MNTQNSYGTFELLFWIRVLLAGQCHHWSCFLIPKRLGLGVFQCWKCHPSLYRLNKSFFRCVFLLRQRSVIIPFPSHHVQLLSVCAASSVCEFAPAWCHSRPPAASCGRGARPLPGSAPSRCRSSPKRPCLDARTYPRRCSRPPKALQFALLMGGLWLGSVRTNRDHAGPNYFCTCLADSRFPL